MPLDLPRATSQQPQQLLDASAPVEGELGTSEPKRFRISLSAGQFVRVIAEQVGVDFSVSLFAPDGKFIAGMDGPYGDRGTESISSIAEVDGEYTVELRESKKAIAAGRFKLSIEGPRVPSQTDLTRVRAERMFAAAQNLSKQREDESKLKAIALYKDALTLWDEAGDRYEKAKTLLSLSRTVSARSDLAAENEIVRYDTQAIELSRQIADRHGEALALQHFASIYITSAPRKALDLLTESLALWRAEGEKPNEAIALNMIGGAYVNMGDVMTALQYYNESLVLRTELNDRVGIANMLNNIGEAYDRLGESQEALKHFQQVVDKLGKTPEIGTKALAAALNNTAYVLLAMGDAEDALDYCTRSLPRQREANNALGEVGTLLNIGHARLQLGEPQTALSLYDEAEQLCAKIARQKERAYTLMYKGEAYTSLGKSQAALSLFVEARDILRNSEDREGEALALTKIAGVLASEGDTLKSLKDYGDALALWRAIRDPRGQAAALYGIARVERVQGNLTEAHKNAEAAIEKTEVLRARVVSRELRTSYLASVRDYYDLEIDLLMQLHKRHPLDGYDSRALQVSERARARSFLESLGEVGQEIREGVDPNLLERERVLQRQIEAKIQAQIGLLKDKSTENQAAQIESELKSLSAERRTIEEKIRVQSPRYSALIQPQPIGVEEIQNKLLDAGTLLLEYALGEQRSYLWLVSSSQIKSYELPGRALIEASARQVYNLVSSSEAVFPVGQAEYWKKAAALSQMILGPVASQLGDKRLLIVPEGALQYLPFHALPIPQTAPGNTRSTIARPLPLIAEHEVVSFPSISALAALRAELATRKPTGKGIAVFADPVFGKDDKRLQSATNISTSQRPQSEESNVRGAFREFARYGITLAPLKNSRAEADAIRSMSADAKIYLDFDANLQNAKSVDLGSYRIVHFATHGLLDSNQPDLSCIALSLVDGSGKEQDGFLLLNDIYNLNLSADLVVLSACSTALGKDIRGEGLVGLTRGFMYAGAARVMASLWNVDDKRTAELIKHFYEKMLKEKMQPAAALRAAQLEMWRSRNNNSPYYWGAFVLQGEWKHNPTEGVK